MASVCCAKRTPQRVVGVIHTRTYTEAPSYKVMDWFLPEILNNRQATQHGCCPVCPVSISMDTLPNGAVWGGGGSLGCLPRWSALQLLVPKL